jgi:hypothetical protein
MVDFVVFNELSLPLLDDGKIKNNFGFLFEILNELKKKSITTIRMDKEFKDYPEIIEGISFQEFFGKIEEKEFQQRIRSFVTNSTIKIDSPLIKFEESDNYEKLMENEYFYEGISTTGGLACSDIWNNISISFKSSEKWDNDSIHLMKNSISNTGDIESNSIYVKHSSKIEHLYSHNSFFEEYENEKRLELTKDNFWEKRMSLFSIKVFFCNEVKEQVKELDPIVFKQFINILREIELSKKKIFDFSIHSEGLTVKTNSKMRAEREFTLPDTNEKELFTSHLTSLSNGNRMYFMEKGKKVFIGYIGNHLTTKKFK